MPRVEYSSDDNTSKRPTALWYDHSDGPLRNASRGASSQAKAATHETESFLEAHKSQIVALAVAGGLVIAGLFVSKLRSKQTQDKKAETGKGAGAPSAAVPSQPAAPQAKKLAVRRKRSGYATPVLALTAGVVSAQKSF